MNDRLRKIIQYRDENNIPVCLEDWLNDSRAKPIRVYVAEPSDNYDLTDTSKYNGWDGDLVNQYD